MLSVIIHFLIVIFAQTFRKFATADGTRYFWEARYITATFDANPKVLIETDRLLKNEEGVLRSFTVKMKTTFDKAKENSYRNVYAGAQPTRYPTPEETRPRAY